MPHIKPLTVNNGSADVVYNPAASDASSTSFVNRGSSLAAVSILTVGHTPAAANATVARNRLTLNKRKEVASAVPGGSPTRENVLLIDVGTALSVTATRAERLAAFTELKAFLALPEVETAIVDNEPFYG